jgi:hypothetical protein
VAKRAAAGAERALVVSRRAFDQRSPFWPGSNPCADALGGAPLRPFDQRLTS